ncbi:unnamed protein product [Phytophthora lilii]|uniref:Hexosyltransferase n=1 Tax=Phytophthora lilii TaxID=2077276 RepID=A0A9W6TU62_9STRA|nr:unnamed protein product [Phytophthora lilii]
MWISIDLPAQPDLMPRRLLLLLLSAAAWAFAASTADHVGANPPTATPELLQGLRILYPEQRAQYKSPLASRFELVAQADFRELMDAYAGRRWLCLQLDGVWRQCISIESGTLITEAMDTGNHTARLVLSDAPTPEAGRLLLQSDEIAFTILSEDDFAALVKQKRLDELALYGLQLGEKDMGVVEWFRSKLTKKEVKSAQAATPLVLETEVDAATGDVTPHANRDRYGSSPTNPPFLVIGVKSRVLDGFRFRQAIRSTWASKSHLASNVRVFFAACRVPNDAAEEVHQAIAYEQKIYGGDLLTDVLSCEDSYATLTEKVKEFLHFVGTDHTLRRASYVMIADEDVYIRADTLAAELAAMGPLHDVYAGHVKEGNTFLPERDPQRRYYLPESVYPMDEFPPFAWGPHYLMSIDVVEFISDNHVELQGLGGLDDVSVALWLLAIQVHPQHLAPFQNLRESPCTNELYAYADLGTTAMHIIQSNLQSGRDFCHGFNVHTWDKDA